MLILGVVGAPSSHFVNFSTLFLTMKYYMIDYRISYINLFLSCSIGLSLKLYLEWMICAGKYEILLFPSNNHER